eukprot:TRINITY_DN860_c0_g1_i1.p1 TRINITY_DN860_c0_g1~~TRINITY_DN860_c0_g1_i1.p1  ORF type:complete len:855 (+),score=312.15 TRINITY_DN860_c0_g1_i1:157-2721(+)
MAFRWSQQSLTVNVIVPTSSPSIKKQDVDVSVTGSTLKVIVSGSTICEGNLFAAVNPAKTKWDIGKSGIQISLEKANPKGPKWSNLFVSNNDGRKRMRALYEYAAGDAVELTLKEGDVILVVKEDTSGWWKGELNGKSGLFPSNFCEEVQDNFSSSQDVQESAPEPEQEAFDIPPPIAEESAAPARVPMPGMGIGMIPNMNELKSKLANRQPNTSKNPPPPVAAAAATPTSPVIGPGLLKKSAPPPNNSPPPVDSPPTVPPSSNKPSRPTPTPAQPAAAPAPVVSLKGSGGLAPKKEPPAPIPQAVGLPPPIVVDIPPPLPVESSPPVVKCKALYEYFPNSETEMALAPGDIIVVQMQQEDGWWLGDIDDANGFRSGYFPCDYVELIAEEESKSDPEVLISEDLDSISSSKKRLEVVSRTGGAKGRRPPSRKVNPIKATAVESEPKSAPAVKKAAAPGLKSSGGPAPKNAAPPADKPAPPAVEKVQLKKTPREDAEKPAEKAPAAGGSFLANAKKEPAAKTSAPPAEKAAPPAKEPVSAPSSVVTFEKSGPIANWPSELPPWEEFCQGLAGLLAETKKSAKEKAPHVAEYGGHGEHFGISVVSAADGRKFSSGDNHYFPIGNVSSVFVYLTALAEGSEKEVDKLTGHQFVPEEQYFTPSKIPGNPFLPGGSATLIHHLKGNNDGAKVANILNYVSLAAGERASCNLPTFFSLQDSATGHQLSALLHHMKGHGGLPHGVRVKKLINTLLGLYAVELDIAGAATAAATLANDGVNPGSGQKCFDPKFVKKAKDLLVSAGDLQESPLLAKYGSSGVLIVVVPKVAGIAVHAPSLSIQSAQEFLNKLVQKYPHLKNVK